MADCELLELETAQALPRVLPVGWRHPAGQPDNCFQSIVHSLAVFLSVERHSDSRRWLHVSVSHRDRIPSWDELRSIKDLFIGRDKKAIQVLPPESEYVNHCPRCLHLWCCLDGDGLPDFRRHGGTL